MRNSVRRDPVAARQQRLGEGVIWLTARFEAPLRNDLMTRLHSLFHAAWMAFMRETP